MTKFDIKKDSELTSTGSHFFCQGCLQAKPIEEMSKDYRYCQECYDRMKEV